jgi:hypothetical protein
MNALDVILLFASAILALASRRAMKRYVERRLGKASDALLEIDFWRAASGRSLKLRLWRCFVFVELLSWAATALLVATLAMAVLQ